MSKTFLDFWTAKQCSRWLWLVFPAILLTCRSSLFDHAPPSIGLEVHTIRDASLEDFAEVSRAVKLETRDDSLLGEISDLKVDPRNGDMVIADLRATKGVYRFDRDGNFLRRYGRMGAGPGEYERLLAFDLLDDGRVVLVGFYQMMLFAEDGHLLLSRENRWAIHWIESAGNQIFAYITGGFQKEAYSVLVFDDQLKLQRKFRRMDPRLKRISLLPYDGMAQSGDSLFISDLYNFRITRYDLSGHAVGAYNFPNFNEEIAFLDQGQGPLTDAEIKKLSRNLHHARRIDAFGKYLSILEANSKRNLMRNLLLDGETNQLYRFEGLRFVESRETRPYLTVDRIVGSFPDGLIASLEDPERFERIKARYPALASQTLVETDNPLILFLTVKAR